MEDFRVSGSHVKIFEASFSEIQPEVLSMISVLLLCVIVATYNCACVRTEGLKIDQKSEFHATVCNYTDLNICHS